MPGPFPRDSANRHEALEQLLPELRAYARSVGGASEAEDLVQDAIERALKSPNRPDNLTQLRPWMFRVIRNLSIDEVRRQIVRREYSATQSRLFNGATANTDADRDLIVRLAYESLSPHGREIVFLVDIMGMKYSEAAQIVGVPAGTVMSRLSRARRDMLNYIKGTKRRDGTGRKHTGEDQQ